jgi:hypothetical protein
MRGSGRAVDELTVDVMYSGPEPLAGERLDEVASGRLRSAGKNWTTGRCSSTASPSREAALAATKDMGCRKGKARLAAAMQTSRPASMALAVLCR